MIQQKFLHFSTDSKEKLYDITQEVENFLEEVKKQHPINNGFIHVYAQGATAAIMIQENWDQSVQKDVISLLKKLIPGGIWEHDKQDGNGDAHLKSGLVGPSETIPIINGKLGLSTWQNIFFCEFDGPRNQRTVVFTLFG